MNTLLCKVARASLSWLLLGSPAMVVASPVLLTGEVFSRQAQEIIVPLTSNGQARISRMIPEGRYVQVGETVVEFDGTEAARAMEQQRETVRTEQARTQRDLARLEKEVIQADFQLQQSQVSLQLAQMRAEVPESLLGAIEYAENQLAYEEAERAVDNARTQLSEKRSTLADRAKQAELDGLKNALQLNWWGQLLNNFKVIAQRPGYVIYGNHPWTRAKYEEGDTVRTSFKLAQVADTRDLAVKVWINSVDRPAIENGARVRIVLDAIPDLQVEGRITQVLDSGSKRNEWGEAVYFEGIVEFTGGQPEGVLPGMSVLVDVQS